jgi:glycosyltransferase involved in cell wall biosynthesis
LPKVSVVLNCYNHEPYVAEAIGSVLAQTFADFELILIDNGSTDGTRAVLERHDDPRIRRLFFDTNESLSKRLNQGAAAAAGEYLCILYSDDMMLPDKLERQVRLLDALPPDFGLIYGPPLALNQRTGQRWQHKVIALDGPFLPAIFRRYNEGFPDISSPLYRRACFDTAHWHEDLFSDGEAIMLRIGLRWKFRYDPAPSVILRDHGGNMGKAIQKNHDMLMAICDRLGAEPEFPPAYAADLDRFRSATCRGNAWVALRIGSRDTGWVRRQLARGARARPVSALHPRWLGSALFACVPAALRDRLNALGRRLTGVRENASLVTDY